MQLVDQGLRSLPSAPLQTVKLFSGTKENIKHFRFKNASALVAAYQFNIDVMLEKQGLSKRYSQSIYNLIIVSHRCRDCNEM